MNKQELQKKYQEIVLKTNGGNDDYVVALCQIANAINELDEPKDTRWQKLKEWLNKEADHVRYTPYDCRSLSSDFELWHLNKILEKMQELEGEDEQI